MPLEPLTRAALGPGSDGAQRFLGGAFDSVNGLLATLEVLRAKRKEKYGDIRGRLAENEVDLLRAAVVFTGAGLDATLKRLIGDTLPSLLDCNELAHKKFEKFVAGHLGTGEIADTAKIARYLTSPNPRQRLIEDYIYDLTGSSLQSDKQVHSAAGALGIDDEDLRTRISGLRPLFTMRNQISHELDLLHPLKQGDRARRSRSLPQTVKQLHEGLEVGQLIINATCGLLPPF